MIKSFGSESGMIYKRARIENFDINGRRFENKDESNEEIFKTTKRNRKTTEVSINTCF